MELECGQPPRDFLAIPGNFSLLELLDSKPLYVAS